MQILSCVQDPGCEKYTKSKNNVPITVNVQQHLARSVQNQVTAKEQISCIIFLWPEIYC
jgi:hypothetical protein